MKNLKANLTLIVLVVLSIPGFTQQVSPVPTIKIEKPKRECEFSFFVGRSFFGPSNEAREAVAAQALTTMPVDPYGYSYEPVFQTSPSYFFEFKYNFTQQSGISISRGTMDAFSFSQSGYAPTIKGGFKSTSFNYEHSLGRHELSTGISILSIHMKSTDKDDIVSGKDVARKVGLNLGYAYHIIESNGFFLAFHAQYNFAGSVEVGPYSVFEPGYNYDYIFWSGHVDSQTTQYPAVKVNLDSFNVGFTAGFRFSDMAESDIAHN